LEGKEVELSLLMAPSMSGFGVPHDHQMFTAMGIPHIKVESYV